MKSGPRDVVVLGLLATLPALLGFITGTLSDRMSKKRIMLVSDWIRLVLIIALILSLTIYGYHFWIIGFIFLFMSIANFVFMPALNSILPNLVEDKDLTEANGLIQSSVQISAIIGALFGAVLIASVGPISIFAFNGFTFMVSIISIMLIRIRMSEKETTKSKKWDISWFSDIKEGFMYIRQFVVLKKIMMGMFFVNLLYVPFYTLGASWSVDILKEGSRGYSLMEAFLGGGSLCGALLAKWIEKGFGGKNAFLLALLPQVTIVFFPLAKSLWLSLAILFLFGFGLGIWNTLYATYIHRTVEDKIRGRIFGVTSTIVGGAFPIGSGVFAILLNSLNVIEVFWIASAGISISVLYMLIVIMKGIDTNKSLFTQAEKETPFKEI